MIEATQGTFRQSLESRLSELRSELAFRHYLRVRDWALEVKDLTRGDPARPVDPSAYWTDELDTLDYMWDASPLTIAKLRHHTYTVTGLRAYDYRAGKGDAGERLATKLEALVAIGGPQLLVPEAPILGGFGHKIEGSLYNIDTLKFYEVLIALERGAMLGGIRESRERSIVLEIGAGWGGFPYQFKRLFPDVTYVIVDLPELFLFSSTYLSTALPGSEVVFWGDPALKTDEGWRNADFVLVPNTAIEELELPRLDLALNMVSFQEMTSSQVGTYVRRVHELGSPFLYSLNRERSVYNEELESVQDEIEQHFWARELQVLPVNYTKMLDAKAAQRSAADARSRNDYRHLLATRRLQT